MPAAIAIPLITGAASAGASIVGAKMASNSANNALRAQERSAAQAQNVQRDQFQQQQQRMQPYVNVGQQATQTLGQLGQQRAPMFNAQQPGGGFNPQSIYGQQPSMGGMVNMRTPDGQVRRVPANMVEQAKMHGGQVVP